MDRMSRDLREAFDRQQAAMGSLAGARERVMSGALASRDTGGRRPLRLAGGVVAVLLAAAIVGTLVLTRSGGRAHQAVPAATATPSPASSATPAHLTHALDVPATQPVILFPDGTDPAQLDGVSWDGRSSGRVGPMDPSYPGIVQNPAGTLYQSGQDVRDRSGRVVERTANAKAGIGTWADDGQHYCQVTSPTPPATGSVPGTLAIGAPGQPLRTVAQVGTVGQQTFVSVDACSVLSDRAVVAQSGGQGVSTVQVWVVQLSTGRVIWAHSYPNTGSATVEVRASRDGQYVAEVSAPFPAGSGPASTTIVGPDGNPVTHVAGGVEAFSWDGTLAVEGTSPGAVSVVRWRDGGVVWTGPAGRTVTSALAEPGGQRIAVALWDPTRGYVRGYPPVDVYAVGPDGQARLLLQDVTL
jgi:hypothetical protein